MIPTQRFRLDNAPILTCEDKTIIDNGSLVVVDDRIAEMPNEFESIDQIIDANHRTVMPGL